MIRKTWRRRSATSWQTPFIVEAKFPTWVDMAERLENFFSRCVTTRMNDRQFTILFLASSYPRDATDSASVFLRDPADHLAQNSVKIDVLVPADGKADTSVEGQVTVHRFRYLPSSRQTLAYGSGILPNLKRTPRLWLHVPLFVMAMAVRMCRLLATRRIDVIHAHWLLPKA